MRRLLRVRREGTGLNLQPNPARAKQSQKQDDAHNADLAQLDQRSRLGAVTGFPVSIVRLVTVKQMGQHIGLPNLKWRGCAACQVRRWFECSARVSCRPAPPRSKMRLPSS